MNIVNTNKGMESLNRLFKYNYITHICRQILLLNCCHDCNFLFVRSYQTYSTYNSISANLRLSGSYQKYIAIVPDYLQKRPPSFVKQCLKNKFAAEEIQENDITCLNHHQRKFQVKSSRNKKQETKLPGPIFSSELHILHTIL